MFIKMNSIDFRDTLKYRCIEVYCAYGSLSLDSLSRCIRGAVVAVNFVQCDQQHSKWLILLQNTDVVTRVLQDTSRSPLFCEGQQLTVRPCQKVHDIPREWEQYIQVSDEKACNRHLVHGLKQPDSPTVKHPGSPSVQNVHTPAQMMANPFLYNQHSAPFTYPIGNYPGGQYPEGQGLQSPKYQEQSSNKTKQDWQPHFRLPSQPFVAYNQRNQPCSPQLPPEQFMNTPSMYPLSISQSHIEIQQSGYQMSDQTIPTPTFSSHTSKTKDDEVLRKLPKHSKTQERRHKTSKNSIDRVEGDSCADEKIRITKLPSSVTKSKLRSFFQSREKSGGGMIKSVDYNKDKNEAVVTFEDPSVIQRILGKRTLVFESKHICVEECVDDSEGQREICEYPNVVEVSGMKTTTSLETVELYFESKRATGVEIDNIQFEFNEFGRIVWVKYKSKEDMKRVLAREHIIDRTKLKVREYLPSKQSTLYEEDKVLLKGVNPTTTKDGLINFLEARADALSVDVLFGEEEGEVIVSFEEPPDFQKLGDACKRKAVDGNILQMSRIPVSNCIMITNILKGTGEDTVQLYFENERRSGGGDVERVDYKSEDGTCYIYFEDYKVVGRVCSRKHEINDHMISVNVFHPILDRFKEENPKFIVPEMFTVASIDKQKIRFLLLSRTNKTRLETLLKAVHTNVIWPEKHEDGLKCECLLTKDVKNCKQLAKTWKDIAYEKLMGYLDTLSVERLNVVKDAWQNMMSLLRDKNVEERENCVVAVDQTIGEIIITGHCQLVRKIFEELNEDFKDIIDNLDREKTFVNEQFIVKPCELLLMDRHNFGEKTQKKYHELKVKFDYTSNKISLEGMALSVEKAKNDTHGFIKTIIVRDVSQRKYTLLQHQQVGDYVSQRMKVENISAVWEMENETTRIYAISDEEAGKASRILKQVIKETRIDFEEDSQIILSTEMWEDRIKYIKNNRVQHAIEIEWDSMSQTIVINSTEVDCVVVVRMIKQFLSDNKMIKEELPLENWMKKCLNLPDKQLEIKEIEKLLMGDFVRFEVSDVRIVIKGTDVGIKKAKQQVSALIKRIRRKRHTVYRPGITSFLNSKEGQGKLRIVEKIKDVIIIQDDSSNESNEEQICTENIQEKARVETENCMILLYYGDITDLSVDVLVNATNKKLKMTGGLAKVIQDKGGEEIRKNCKMHTKNHGELKDGVVFYGCPGKLKCKSVAHAVIPAWQNGNEGEEHNLYKIVHECLRYATREGYSSVAIPTLGAGTYGIPVDVTTRAVISAIDDFVSKKRHSHFLKVCLCDVKLEAVNSFLTALEKQFGKVIKSNIFGENEWTKSAGTTKSKNTKDKGQSLVTDEGFVLPADHEFHGNIEVEIVKGEIAKQKVDVIVNTTSNNLQLNLGKVSKSLLNAAGKDLQQDCNILYPDGIHDGEVAITRGYNLRCKYVFHGSLPQWNGGEMPKMLLEIFMNSCLEKVHELELQSVAFPALGTGSRSYPTEFVAKEMSRLVSQFSGNHPRSSLKIVKLVIKNGDTYKTFQKVSESMKSSPTQSTSLQFPEKCNDRSRERTGSRSKFQTMQNIKKIQLNIYEGDITMANVDAIVIGTNAEFDLSRGQISKIVRKAGGSELDKQIDLIRNGMKKKGFVLTNGINLPCKFVIYLNAEERTKTNWKKKIILTLEEAENSGNIKSVAFPALGTGLCGGPTLEEFAKDFLDALFQFQKSKEPVDLREVHVIIYQNDRLQEFLKIIEDNIKKHSSVLPGYNKLEWNPKYVTMEQASYPLMIYGKSSKDIDDAARILNEILKEGYKEKIVTDEILKEFTEFQEGELKLLKETYEVEMHIDKRRGKLCINGMSENIAQASDELHKLLRKIDRDNLSEQEVELIAHRVMWCYIEKTGTRENLVKYSPHINRILEKAYKRQEQRVTFTDDDGNDIWIDLQNLEAFVEKDQKIRKKVLRKLKAEESKFDVPTNWTEMTDETNIKVVCLQSSDQEFIDVVTEFQNTVGNPKHVTKVERIQNRTLYQQYLVKKHQMDKENTQGTQNERLLWHGTSPEAVDSINAYGFNRSYCGKNATVYGNGVYFAVQAYFSAQDTYSRADEQGNKKIYYCKVLTGEFTQGQRDLRVPPKKPYAEAHVLYDSVADKNDNPGMFIIFNDTQAYPEYLLTFK